MPPNPNWTTFKIVVNIFLITVLFFFAEYNIDDLIRQKTTFNSSSSVVPGTVLHYKADNSLVVKCLNGWVAFRNVVLKKPMSSQDFYNGYLSKVKPKTLNIFESRENFLYADIYNEKVTDRKNS